MTGTRITLDLSTVETAALQLASAARFDTALDLLDSLENTTDSDTRFAIQLSRARVLDRRRHLYGPTDTPVPDPLAEAVALAPANIDPTVGWDLDELRFRRAYDDALVDADGIIHLGPAGREPADIELLAEHARRLHTTAPDDLRRAWGAMCQGWVADNVAGDRDHASVHYAEALEVARATDDPALTFEAQRHLGDHAHDDGDLDAALAAWRESAGAAARAGMISGVLAQHQVLAVLARDAGDEAGAVMLSRELRRWAAAIGARLIADTAEAFLEGADPTQPPPKTPQP